MKNKKQKTRVLMLPPIPWKNPAMETREGGGDQAQLISSLYEHGVVVDIIDPYGKPVNPLAGKGTFLQAIDFIRAIKVLLMKRDYDLIVSVFQAGAIPLLALRRAFAYKVPIAIWDMNLEPTWRLGQASMRYVLPRISGAFTLTSLQKKYIEETWGYNNKLFTISHYVDDHFYKNKRISEVGKYVMSIGNDGGRDYETLIKASKNIGAEVIIRTNNALPELTENVTVIREKLSFTALRDLYSGSRYVVVPLKHTMNPSGVSAVLEAAAMGKPVIVSESSAINDFLRPNHTCLTVPPRDVTALSAAMHRLDTDDALCARLGDNARQMVEQEYSVDVFAARFAKIIRIIQSKCEK